MLVRSDGVVPLVQVAGEVDQSASIMSEDVAEKGFALLCVSEPLTDCKIKTIPEVCVHNTLLLNILLLHM